MSVHVRFEEAPEYSLQELTLPSSEESRPDRIRNISDGIHRDQQMKIASKHVSEDCV